MKTIGAVEEKKQKKAGKKAVPVVAVAQLVESRIVIPVVVGSSPISHPTEFNEISRLERLFSFALGYFQ